MCFSSSVIRKDSFFFCINIFKKSILFFILVNAFIVVVCKCVA